ncbi:hypothetical protein MRB53_021277 [Persea americana]|uniref:Uncharacterized protein n=1 Tax=Persea americana TaxID=3435 RepID=A0ACC2L3R6_PERAE|nr:hypothetical protein MRB53_021277 [Persea americana]
MAKEKYYNCLLRYSDWRFFSQVEVNQRQGLYNVQNISDPVRFDTLVRTLMENVSTTAAMNPSRIGTGVTNYTQFASLYGLAQLNPIQLSIPSPPPPPVAATSPSNAGPDDSGRNTAGGNGKRNSAWRTAFIILISIIVALALISILCLYLFTRRRLKKRTSAVGKVEEVKDMELHGYMAPEYATQGQFSIKSDVYSFGVLVLEIVTGLKNSSFDESESSYDLLSYVWRHWTEGTQLELIDKTLCKDFPSPPPFYVGKSKLGSYARARDPLSETEASLSVDKSKPCSVNEVSITELDPR